MQKTSRTYGKSAALVCILLILAACVTSPAVRRDKDLAVTLFTELPSHPVISFSAGDSGEYTRRIASAAAKMYKSGSSSGDSFKLILHTELRHRERKSSGFMSKQYEIYMEGTLVDQDSQRVGMLEGSLEYKRAGMLLAGAGEAGLIDSWDRDFVDWSAARIIEALTSSLNI